MGVFSSDKEFYDAVMQIAGVPVSWAKFNFLSNPEAEGFRFHKFQIPKKHGGFRTIYAPHSHLKAVEGAVLRILESTWSPGEFAMGFIRGRNIRDNAVAHVGHRYVFNLDLKDFFPSISYDQVARALLSAIPGISMKVALMIAGLSCVHENGRSFLAQGSRISPILSNIFCSEMDKELAALAENNGVSYTRYADDISFSSDSNVFTRKSPFLTSVEGILSVNGLTVNKKKTRLRTGNKRQEVTGVVVNEKPNVTRTMVREVRSLLYIWERYGYNDAKQAYKKRHGASTSMYSISGFNAIVGGKIAFIGMVRGTDDPLFKAFQEKHHALFEAERKRWASNPQPPVPPAPQPDIRKTDPPVERRVDLSGIPWLITNEILNSTDAKIPFSAKFQIFMERYWMFPFLFIIVGFVFPIIRLKKINGAFEAYKDLISAPVSQKFDKILTLKEKTTDAYGKKWLWLSFLELFARVVVFLGIIILV